LPLWLVRVTDASLFTWVKLYSVILGTTYLLALKMSRRGDTNRREDDRLRHPGGKYLEAALAELAQGGYVNAVVGLVLILTQAPPGAVRVDRDAPRATCGIRSVASGSRPTSSGTLPSLRREIQGVRGVFAGFAAIHLLAPLLAMRGAATCSSRPARSGSRSCWSSA